MSHEKMSITDKDRVIDIDLDNESSMAAGIELLESQIAAIKAQLGAAKATAASSGVYADSHWYRKAESALRFKGADHQKLLKRLGEIRKSKRRDIGNAIEKHFIVVARRRLSPELFREIMDEAQENSAVNAH